MCVLMGYVGVFAEVHVPVVEACLLGDFLWMLAFVPSVCFGFPRVVAECE